MRKEKETDALAKILRRTIIPVLAVMLTASSFWAQSNGLGREVSLSGTHITLGKTITEIQTQTKYRFAYNPDQIDTVATVVFPRHAMTLQMALDVLTAKGKYQYVVRNNFIALSPGEQLAQGANAAERTSTPDDYKIAGLDNRNSVPVEPAGLEIKTTETPTPDTVVRNAPSSNLVLEEVIATVEAMTDEPSFVALKTNILYDATATINLGVEFRTGRRTSVDVSGNWNPFTFCNNRKWKHVLIQPEFRWWTKETFSGHFLGLHAHYAYYNVGNLPKPFSSNLRDHRFEGWLAGVGMSYGYRWNFTPNWGLEATVGVGYARMSYDKYNCETCGKKLGSNTKNYFGPTKAGVTLIYSFGKKQKSVPVAPAYIPPVVRQPEPVVIAEPKLQPEPEPQPLPTTAERLAEIHSFLAPVSKLDDSFYTDPERFIEQHRKGSMSIYFRQGAKVVDRSYKDNITTLYDLLSAIREVERSSDSRIVRVVIAGFASPEGSTTVNDRLAKERATAIRSYLTENTAVNNEQVELYNGGVDWYALRRMVAESDMPEKGKVLDIIDNTPIWDAGRNVGRHGELMRLSGGEPYRYMLRNFFPNLRNAAYIRAYYENK